MPRKEKTAPEEKLERLELLRQYFSTTRTARCDICGVKITEEFTEDDHHVVALAVEWHGDVPTLLARRVICNLCVADVGDFTLPNRLCQRVNLPPEAVDPREFEAERQEEQRESQVAAKTLEAHRLRLEAAMKSVRGTMAQARIGTEIDELVTKVVGINSGGAEFPEIDADHVSADEVPLSGPPNRHNLRDAVRVFLRSPYQNQLPRGLERTAYLYTSGLDEAAIAKKIKLSQPTVSRQIREILRIARRRR
jgi:hypothetical protein